MGNKLFMRCKECRHLQTFRGEKHNSYRCRKNDPYRIVSASEVRASPKWCSYRHRD